eukprot:gene9018-9953_t
MDQTPRSLLKTFHHTEDAPLNSFSGHPPPADDPRLAIKGFLRPKESSLANQDIGGKYKNEEEEDTSLYKDLLESSVFRGYDPQVQDQVFRLGRYATFDFTPVPILSSTSTSATASSSSSKTRTDSKIDDNQKRDDATAVVTSPSSSSSPAAAAVSSLPSESLPQHPRTEFIVMKKPKAGSAYSGLDYCLLVLNVLAFLGILSAILTLFLLYLRHSCRMAPLEAVSYYNAGGSLHALFGRLCVR